MKIEVGNHYIGKNQPELKVRVEYVRKDCIFFELAQDWGGCKKGHLFYQKREIFLLVFKEIDNKSGEEEKGYRDGYKEGYQDGYNNGYKQGFAESERLSRNPDEDGCK